MPEDYQQTISWELGKKLRMRNGVDSLLKVKVYNISTSTSLQI